jgi:hypothetical protein
MAAARAPWIPLYGGNFAAGWQRVEACRLALFGSADRGSGVPPGKGILDVPKMLDSGLATQIQQELQANQVQPSPVDSVSFPFLRLLLGSGPPGSEEEGCTKPRQRRLSGVPPTGNCSTAFTLLREALPCRPLRSPGCANCSRQNRGFPMLSQRSCERGAYSWLETLAG